jgi:hypothetical protein
MNTMHYEAQLLRNYYTYFLFKSVLFMSKALSICAYTVDWVTHFYIPLKLCDNITEVILQLCLQNDTFFKFNIFILLLLFERCYF